MPGSSAERPTDSSGTAALRGESTDFSWRQESEHQGRPSLTAPDTGSKAVNDVCSFTAFSHCWSALTLRGYYLWFTCVIPCRRLQFGWLPAGLCIHCAACPYHRSAARRMQFPCFCFSAIDMINNINLNNYVCKSSIMNQAMLDFFSFPYYTLIVFES